MSTESLIIGFAVAWGVWILLRIHRSRGARRSLFADKTTATAKDATAKDTAARSMPRLGKLGTMTPNQARTLKFNNFATDKQWSFEEAALILDALTYLRAVCRDMAGEEDGPAPLKVQNELLRLILTDQDLRDYVRRWGERRREEGAEEDEFPTLTPNQQFERIAAKAREYLLP